MRTKQRSLLPVMNFRPKIAGVIQRRLGFLLVCAGYPAFEAASRPISLEFLGWGPRFQQPSFSLLL